METSLNLVLFMFSSANWTFCLWSKKKTKTKKQITKSCYNLKYICLFFFFPPVGFNRRSI